LPQKALYDPQIMEGEGEGMKIHESHNGSELSMDMYGINT